MSATPTTPPQPGDTVQETTTYLHLPAYAAFRPALEPPLPPPAALVQHVTPPDTAFYRYLYDMVGRSYWWLDRRYWSDERLTHYLRQPTVTLLVLYVHGNPAGYIELLQESEEPGTEVAYFGLGAAYHGRGLGKYLLSVGVQRAFDDGATRVWLHTCNLDGQHALANYQARGFVPYRSITATVTLPPFPPDPFAPMV